MPPIDRQVTFSGTKDVAGALAFDTAPLRLGDWLLCVGLASIVLWADEAKKLLQRSRRHAIMKRAMPRG